MKLCKLTCDTILARALEAASKMDCAMSIAICDAGGHLLQFCRMDGAFVGSADIAMRKANTSAMFNAPSGVLGELVRKKALTGFELSNDGLMLFGGGLPIRIDGELIGAIGVSGGSAEQDVDVATEALEVLQ